MWLENGTDTAGLNHIITEHADDFLNKGITQEQIPDYVMNALENGKSLDIREEVLEDLYMNLLITEKFIKLLLQ